MVGPDPARSLQTEQILVSEHAAICARLGELEQRVRRHERVERRVRRLRRVAARLDARIRLIRELRDTAPVARV
jgi:hypothetical protein